ncbi:MAG TPA: MBL fold metallo-hydrolase [Edaphocola sp.]|nr:MBL fold metallo-hydrolase [Edaphocola sp.]
MTQIIPLSEGTFTIGRDKIFQPFDEHTEELTDRPTGSLLVEVQPFLIINDRDIILLDTGLGFNSPDGKAHLAGNLLKHNIRPEDITKVLLSHLHKDHAGGIDTGLFSHAGFHVYKNEMAYAEKIGFPSYYPDELQGLKTCDRVHWLEGETGSIDHYIHFEHTNGHCPEHIVFKIESEEGIIFYGGDEAPQYKQMKFKYVAKYDYDGRKAMELRKKWAEQGAAEGWRFLFYHDVQVPVARMS